MYMYVCMYMYVYIYIYIYICIHTYVYIYTHICIHILVYNTCIRDKRTGLRDAHQDLLPQEGRLRHHLCGAAGNNYYEL